eukprot:SAG31_NODE_320_length_17748_cov_4.201881_6_plen_122_part_00
MWHEKGDFAVVRPALMQPFSALYAIAGWSITRGEAKQQELVQKTNTALVGLSSVYLHFFFFFALCCLCLSHTRSIAETLHMLLKFNVGWHDHSIRQRWIRPLESRIDKSRNFMKVYNMEHL